MSENAKGNLAIFLILFFGISGGIFFAAEKTKVDSVEFKQEHCPHFDEYTQTESTLAGSEIYIPTEQGEVLYHIVSAAYTADTYMFRDDCSEIMSLFGYWVLEATEESTPEVEDFDFKADIVKSPIDGKIVTWLLRPLEWSSPWEITTLVFSFSDAEIRH